MAVHGALLGRGDQRVVGNRSAVAARGGRQEQAAVLKDPTWADCTVLGPWVPVWLSGCRGSNWLWCFTGPGSPLCIRLCYIPLDGRGHPTTFPFPNREIIPGRCLAQLVHCTELPCWLTETGKSFGTWKCMCLHTSACSQAVSLAKYVSSERLLAVVLETFSIQVHRRVLVGHFKGWAAFVVYHYHWPAAPSLLWLLQTVSGCLATRRIPSVATPHASCGQSIPVFWGALGPCFPQITAS